MLARCSAHAQGYVSSTFQALTDALVPSASDLNVHEYVIDGLDQYITIQEQLYLISFPLSYPTARMLDSAAEQLHDMAFARLSRDDGGRNSVYVATSSFRGEQKQPGWGSFRYDQRLVLTKEGHRSRSYWQLPACFQGEQDRFVPKIKTWQTLDDGSIEMQTTGRGDQEMYVSSTPEVVTWAEGLIRRCSVY